MKKLTLKEAKRLSLLKWEFIVNNGGDFGLGKMITEQPELKSLNNNCGFCERAAQKFGGCQDKSNCPLWVGNLACPDTGHPWDTWRDISTRENAEAVLDLIKAVKA